VPILSFQGYSDNNMKYHAFRAITQAGGCSNGGMEVEKIQQFGLLKINSLLLLE